jgi:hypothetical protein
MAAVRGTAQRLFAFCLAALALVGTLTEGGTYLWCSTSGITGGPSCVGETAPAGSSSS